METPLYCLPPPFSSFSNPLPLAVALFPWLDVFLCQCVILLNDMMDLHLPSLGTLAPEAYCYVLYATRRQFYCRLTTQMT